MSALNRVLEVSKSALADEFPVVQSMALEGTLPADPAHVLSQKAVGSLPKLLDLAVCARVGDALLASSCQKKALSVALKWARTYKPSGNPIDENQFIPLFRAIDLLTLTLGNADKAELLRFVRQFASEGDRLFSMMKPNDKRLTNNWQTWRLALRGTAGVVIGDSGIVSTTKAMFAQQISKNINADGSTNDFADRDALHYQVYDLEAYETALSLTPDLFSMDEKQKVDEGLLFLRPFYLKQKSHIEFVHSTVDFDLKRKIAGVPEFQNSPWKPESARALFRIARLNEPDIRSWTTTVVDEHYDPSVKLFASACGEGSSSGYLLRENKGGPPQIGASAR